MDLGCASVMPASTTVTASNGKEDGMCLLHSRHGTWILTVQVGPEEACDELVEVRLSDTHGLQSLTESGSVL